MQFIEGQNRTQSILFPDHLDQLVDLNNEVRFIDVFVESINMNEFQFIVKTSAEGRPSYNPKDLLKLYVYGYLNQIRSSRKLETECHRNIELLWLLKQLAPDHNTISNFRRDNEKAIKKVFRYTVSIAKQFDLIGGQLIAGDSTKLRAQNSKKSNFNPKKIERHLTYIDTKLKEYNQALETADGDTKIRLQKAIKAQHNRKDFYNDLTAQLEATGQTQISLSDPESRQMITRNNITEVAYNVQTVVDAKHCIPIDYKVTNQNDSKAMGDMLRRTKTILQTPNFTALYDKGYHTGSEIKTAIDLGINIIVAVPDVASNAPNKDYNIANFIYNSTLDNYTCPQQNKLTTNGNWYAKDRGKSIANVKHYKTTACKNCPVKNECTNNAKGRLIERSQHAQYIEKNQQNINENKQLYKRRQAIVEHPYGILKRQWGFYYIITKKGIKRASADVGYMFIAYNLRRLLNLVDQNSLITLLKQWMFVFCLKNTSNFMFKCNTNFKNIFICLVHFYSPIYRAA